HFAAPMPFANNLTSLGHYYQGYEAIMAHWHKVLPLPIMDVQYEEMVADHEGMCKRIIDFVGVDWEQACMQSHKTKRTVKTASTWQVRQPLYTTSVERWRLFDKHLDPLKQALGDFYKETTVN
ncbi:MAG TPA: sulfotransferase, partial [Rhodospirillales bacterium]|nr:sulfotransferase [Rhodospirillales bacterium]